MFTIEMDYNNYWATYTLPGGGKIRKMFTKTQFEYLNGNELLKSVSSVLLLWYR